MRNIAFVLVVISSVFLWSACGQSNNGKKNNVKSQAEIQAEIEAQAVEEARQAAELRKTLLAERDEQLKEELGAEEIIGFWSFNHYTLKGTITIYTKKGSYKGRIVFSDKSVHNENLAKEGDGIYYIIENGHHNKAGEYYKITGGNLSVCDKEGNIGWFTQVELHANVQ